MIRPRLVVTVFIANDEAAISCHRLYRQDKTALLIVFIANEKTALAVVVLVLIDRFL